MNMPIKSLHLHLMTTSLQKYPRHQFYFCDSQETQPLQTVSHNDLPPPAHNKGVHPSNAAHPITARIFTLSSSGHWGLAQHPHFLQPLVDARLGQGEGAQAQAADFEVPAEL
jgi:hypothetical protein